MSINFSNLKVLAIPFAALICGCAITNQGAIDYRIERPDGSGGSLSPKYTKANSLYGHLESGDALSVSLKQVFIKDLTEGRSALRYIRGEPATADVAIVASACENPCARKFGAEGVRNSKVIFYSNDVREGQYLNLSNLHGVYGPIAYNGNPFKVDIYIIELDESGEKVRNLLGSLASLGQTFYPPAHPAATVLSALAETFIQDDQDDNVFTYSFDLVAKNPDSKNPSTAHLEVGDYVLIRSEDRSKIIPWKELSLNKSVGRVVKNSSDCTTTTEPDTSCYYTENSYVVLEVSKAGSSIATDSQQVVFSALRSQLDSSSGNMEITSQQIDAIKNSLESVEARDKAKGSISDLTESPPNSSGRRAAALNFVSTWFDPNINVEEHDKQLIIKRTNKMLGGCANLSATEIATYQDEIKNRTTASKPSLISALYSCR